MAGGVYAAGCAGDVCGVKLILTPQYRSEVSLYVTHTDSANNLNVNDINASQKLIDTYIVILQQDEVMAQVANEVALTMPCTYNQVTKSDFHVRPGNTWVLQVEAETDDPELSAAICNAVAKVAPEVLTEVVGAGTAKAIGTAKAATTPSSPNVWMNSAVGGVIGLVLSIVILLLRSLLDNTIKSEEDLKERYDVPILGEIPDLYDAKRKGHIRVAKSVKKTKHREINPAVTRLSTTTPFAITEAYKIVRTNLLYSLASSKSKVVIMSSALPNEGKSTTCANLAITMAQTAARVLLIDADLRKCTQNKIFKLNNSKGLSRLLVGFDTLTDALHQDVGPIWILSPAGPLPPNPSELLGSENMAVLLDKLKEHYDLIIIDTPAHQRGFRRLGPHQRIGGCGAGGPSGTNHL